MSTTTNKRRVRRPDLARRAVITLLSVAVSFVAGCAVTTIDVDVYKGPLSNEENVQIEQTAVMAVAAKPMLIQLRDALQLLTEDEQTDKDHYIKLSKKFDGHIPPVPPGTRSEHGFAFTDDRAERANAILSLLEDRKPDPTVQDLLNRGRQAVENYKRNYQTLRPEQANRGTELLRLGILDTVPRSTSIDIKGVPADFQAAPADADAAKRHLRNAFGEMLNPQRRSPRDVLWFYDEQIFQAHAVLNPTASVPPSANERMFQLTQPAVVNEIVAPLFGPGQDEQREALVAEVVRIAGGFVGARESVDQMIDTVLELCAHINSRPDESHQVPQITRLLAEYLAEIWNPQRMVAAVLAAREQPTRFPASVRRLAARLVGREPELLDVSSTFYEEDNGRKILTGNRELLSRPVVAALLEAPESTATALRDLHHFIKAHGNPLDGLPPERRRVRDNPDFKFPGAWRYGIARGPTSLKTNEFNPEKVSDLLQKIREALSGGLGEGRLDEGLLALIERYVRKVHANPNDPEAAAVERTQLLDELARFSQKVLFLANNDILLPDASVYATTKAPTDDLKGQGRTLVTTYARVLQAVGNAVLVQVNELRASEAHEKAAGPAWEREVRAGGSSLPRDVRGILDRYVQGLLRSQAAGEAASATRAARIKELADLETKQLEVAKQLRAEASAKRTAKETAETQVEGHRVDATTNRQSAKAQRDEITKQELAKAKAETEIAKLTATAEDLKEKVAKATERRDAKEKELKALPDTAPVTEKTRLQEELKKLQAALDELVKKAGANDADAEIQKKELAAAAAAIKLADGRATDFDAKATKADALGTEAEKRGKAAAAAAAEHTTRAADADAAAANAKSEAGRLREETARQVAEGQGLGFAVTVVNYFSSHWPGTDLDDTRSRAADVHARMLRELVQFEVNYDDPSRPRPQLTKDQLRARAELRTRTFNTLTPHDLSQTARNPTAVLDEKVAFLEDAYANAVRESGEDSTGARDLRAAIDAIHGYRARMVYIRPPAAFLKNSYPVTSLQGGTATAWENMLAAHSRRSLPFYELFKSGSNKDQNAVRQIDRQFWQNINRVRVASNGITNYVMAKDDIGNWYVKSFSGDPEPIIKAAKAAALYAGSADAGVDLIAQDRRRKAALDKGQEPPDAPEPAKAFRRQVGSFRDRYEKATRGHATSLSENVGKVRENIATSWNKDDDVRNLDADLPGQMLDAPDAHLVAAKAALADATASGAVIEDVEAGIADALDAMLKYQAAVLEQLGTLPKPDGKPLEEKKKELEAQAKAETEAAGGLKQAGDAVVARRGELDGAHAEVEAANKALASTSTTQPAAEQKRVVDATRSIEQKKAALAAAEASAKTAKDKLEAEKGKTAVAKQAVADEQAKLDKQTAARATAHKVVTARVGATVTDFVGRRIKSTDEYQTAVEVVMESATQARAADGESDGEADDAAKPRANGR